MCRRLSNPQPPSRMSDVRSDPLDCCRPLAALTRVRFRAKCPLKRPNVVFAASAPYAGLRRSQPRSDVALARIRDVLSAARASKRVPHHDPEKRAEKKQRPEKLCEGDAYKEQDSRTGGERVIPAHSGLPLRVLTACRDQRPLPTPSRSPGRPLTGGEGNARFPATGHRPRPPHYGLSAIPPSTSRCTLVVAEWETGLLTGTGIQSARTRAGEDQNFA